MAWNDSTRPYAWLEYERGMWHFLTDLFADAGESSRMWSDKLCALEELKQEGWTVISPYPKAFGYGLTCINNRSHPGLRDDEPHPKTQGC